VPQLTALAVKPSSRSARGRRGVGGVIARQSHRGAGQPAGARDAMTPGRQGGSGEAGYGPAAAGWALGCAPRRRRCAAFFCADRHLPATLRPRAAP
jgi:hypothetical protein